MELKNSKIHMFSYTCFQQLYISTYPSEVRIQSPRPLFDSFHSDGITSSTLPPFLVREKQARLVTREAARDVIARTGRSTVKAPSACFAFLHSRGVSFARRFLRMNKPGLHPPAAARHPLHKARCLPENSSCVLRHPSFPIFRPAPLLLLLPCRRNSTTTILYLTMALSKLPPLLVTVNGSRLEINAALSFLRTVIWTGKLTGDFWFFQELIRVIVEYWIENGRDVFKFLKKSNYSCFFIFLFRLKKQD